MAVQIQFRRGTSGEWTSVDPTLAEAEMGIETDTKLFKIGNGTSTWTQLDYGGIQGYVGSTGAQGPVGYTAVDNVLYVSKSGSDSNDGKSLTYSKLTIAAAVSSSTRGTTIFVKSGDYIEHTPITVPDFVSIVGDNLRSVIVRPTTVTNDIFYVNNGVYIAHMTFKDHQAPAAAISFNPNGSAGVISTSPYVQNCTSMTTDGTGMRVDGSLALGTKSMVVDAFTQYNQGGIGVHMLNRGYTQLVSVFTICCDKGILCESGGFCSITNSNSSFGNYALYADGVSEILYSGNVVGDTSGKTFVIDNLTNKPSIGDAVSFGDGNYYTIAASTAFKIGSTDVIYPDIIAEDALLRNARQIILNDKSKLQVLTINHVLETFPGFDFNQFKCSRDVGDILDAVCYDMVLNTNYRSIKAGTSYYRVASSVVTGEQLTQTLSAINSLKVNTLALLSAGTAKTRVSNLFDIILDIFEHGLGVTPAYVFNPPTGVDGFTVNAFNQLQANKNFIAEETVAYINNFTYNTATCYRDTGLIVDSIAFDLLYGGTSQSVFAGLQYWNQSGYTGDIANELTTTTAAISHVRDLVETAINNAGFSLIDPELLSVVANFNTITNILLNGTVGITDMIIPNGPASTSTSTIAMYNAILSNKTTVQNDTITWINSNYPGFSYNQATCLRDVGYIIDSVAFDLLHGGNRQSIMSGVYYYGFDSTSSVIVNEIPQTTAAYNFIKSISADIIKGNLITATYQLSVSQTVYASSATNVEVGLLNKKISTITNIINNGPSVAPAQVPIGLIPNTSTSVIDAFDLLLANREFIQAETVAFINTSYVGLVYSTATCKRDVGYIIDAVSYDLLYGGNSQTADAADSYYDGAVLRISSSEKLATISAYYFIKTIIDDCILENPVTPYQFAVTQDFSNDPGLSTQSVIAQSLVDIVSNIVENSYSSVVTLAQNVVTKWNDNSPVTFHQYSQITSSAHSFEWIGAGTNIDAALPYTGGEPISANQAVAINGGKVYYTGTDQKGDFRIGNDLVINNSIGTISGRTFTKSLFAIMTPYILAIGS